MHICPVCIDLFLPHNRVNFLYVDGQTDKIKSLSKGWKWYLTVFVKCSTPKFYIRIFLTQDVCLYFEDVCLLSVQRVGVMAA